MFLQVLNVVASEVMVGDTCIPSLIVINNIINLIYSNQSILGLDSRVKGLETDHVHTFALYIEQRAVNIVPFNTS